MSEASADDSTPDLEPGAALPGAHDSDLPDEDDAGHTGPLQEENAGTSEDQPSQ
ncbi:hypothetical protein [Nocardioides sp. cx-173]|uniref:hypothetical protein n=1 Tax=Nocardioides sp. cx-173 TaxID=2898796 RepID=UPI001E423151|nr:hypothetical protein [Nocardioides sp. cx-173]MCD4527087.1 hypothetical protein [Nocardioides sp. cx-173]UGB42451.1 hypothetical protein LQ940_02750 [Nocardioides sp. cx-173]